MNSVYDVLLVPLYIFALLLCLFVQMLQQSTLAPIDAAIPGTHFAIFSYLSPYTDRCGGAEINICT